MSSLIFDECKLGKHSVPIIIERADKFSHLGMFYLNDSGLTESDEQRLASLFGDRVSTTNWKSKKYRETQPAEDDD